MVIKPHDLLEIKGVEDLICYSNIPEWVETALTIAPYVVVRRARAPEGLVAVGVRGSMRNERFAAFLPANQIVSRITPEQLALGKKWRNYSKEIFHYLERVSKLMNNYSLMWGPGGSIGFELASGKETVKATSDIDVIIRFSEGFTTQLAQDIKAGLEIIPVHVDVQVEALEGAFSLSEYVVSEGKSILIRTMDGPILKKFDILTF
jgi:phosphoribosyl-dephospho-CoA transferase